MDTIGGTLNYYDRPEVSNSTLTALKKYWMPQDMLIDLEAAYKFGTLLDALLTEPENVNYFKLTVSGVQYTKADFDKAEEMKKSFMRDTFGKFLVTHCEMQKVSIKHGFDISYDGIDFKLDVRCKWDFFSSKMDLCGDLKSTACTTQKQFQECISHFDYDRQAAFYMDIENKNSFIFMGVSKVNFKVFKIPVKRDSELYREGKAKYANLAFQWWTLYGDIKI